MKEMVVGFGKGRRRHSYSQEETTYLKEAKVVIVMTKLSKDIEQPMYDTKLSTFVSDAERGLVDTSSSIAKFVI